MLGSASSAKYFSSPSRSWSRSIRFGSAFSRFSPYLTPISNAALKAGSFIFSESSSSSPKAFFMPSLSCSLSSFSRSPGFFSSSSPYLTPSAKVILPSSSLAAGLVTASAASSSALVPFKLSRKARILSLAAASKPGKSLSVISSTVAFSSISTPTSRGEYPPSTCASTT